MRNARALLVGAALVPWLAGGCEGRGEQYDERARAAASATPIPSVLTTAAPIPDRTPEDTAEGVNNSPVELLDAGSAPLRALRYRFRAGAQETLSLVTGTSVAVTLEGRELPRAAIPDLKLQVRFAIRSLRPDGTAVRSFRILDLVALPGPALPADVQSQLAATLAELRDLEGGDEIGPRGTPGEFTAGSTGGDPSMGALVQNLQQAFSQMAAPMPEQPVGNGARWQVRSVVVSQGVSVRQTATYELTELGQDSGKLRVEIKQQASGGTIPEGVLPAPIKAELTSLETHGSGVLNFDLSHSIPNGQIENTSSVIMRTTQAGPPQRLRVESSVRVRFSRADPEATRHP